MMSFQETVDRIKSGDLSRESPEFRTFELMFFLTMIESGKMVVYPKDREELMTRDPDAVRAWHAAGIELVAQKVRM